MNLKFEPTDDEQVLEREIDSRYKKVVKKINSMLFPFNQEEEIEIGEFDKLESFNRRICFTCEIKWEKNEFVFYMAPQDDLKNSEVVVPYKWKDLTLKYKPGILECLKKSTWVFEELFRKNATKLRAYNRVFSNIDGLECRIDYELESFEKEIQKNINDSDY